MKGLLVLLIACLLSACARLVSAPPVMSSPHWINPGAQLVPYHDVTSYFVGSTKHDAGPLYPPRVMVCGLEGAATVQFHIADEHRGADFKITEWVGSPAFADALLTYS